MAGISGLNQNYFYGGQTSSSVSTLLGSLGTPSGVSSLSGLVSDYRTIQTGTYGKLLKEYYAQQEDPVKSIKSSYAKSADKAADDFKNSLSDTKSKMEALNKSASALAATGDDSIFSKRELRQADGTVKTDYDKDAIYSAVAKFVGDYNSAVSSAASSSTRSISNGANSLTSTTDVMANNLRRFGISADAQGKLSVSEETLKQSDMAKFQSAISGKGGYASSIAQTASRISGTTSNKLSSFTAATYSYGGGYKGTDAGSLFSSYF